jgi:single-strand DNA-binding protein
MIFISLVRANLSRKTNPIDSIEKGSSMSKGVNKVFLLGHVGKDPEIRTTQGGTNVVNFSLATTDRQKQGEQWVDQTEWHNLVAFSRTAEVIRDYVKKGSQIMIEGKIKTRSWDDKESGQKKFRTEIIVNELTLLGGVQSRDKGNATSRPGSPRPSGKSVNANKAGSAPQSSPSSYSDNYDYSDTEINDSDIPF